MKRYPACILAPCCVPWDEQDCFIEAVFRRAVRTTLTEGTQHLYVFGTAGEGYAVTDQQFDQIVVAFTDEMWQGNAEPMVGVISLSLGTVCERIERCRDMGVRQFQISLPAWGALSERELFEFFDRICGRFRDCYFLHYNLPRTKRMVTATEYGRLAEAHPNLVATKNCGDSLAHIQSLLQHSPQLQHFLSETGYMYGSLCGECGLLASFTMNWPRIKAIFQAGIDHDIGALSSFQQEVNLVMRTLFETVPDNRMDGAYDKMFAKMYDPEFPLRLRPPYVGTSDDEYRAFVRRLRERLPEWVPSPISWRAVER